MNAASGSSIIGQHARHGRLLELSEAAAIGGGGRGREHGRRRRRRCCRLMWRPRADPGGPPLEWMAMRRRSGRRRQARLPHGLASVSLTLVDVANK